MLRRLTASIACAALLSAAGSASAGLFDDPEARARVDKLRAEFNTLAQSVDTASKNQLDFANQLEGMKTELAKLRGQLEVLAHEVETAQKRQKDFYVDLDTRLRKLEPGGGAPSMVTTAAAGAEAGAAVDEAAAAREYEAALNHVKGGRYRDAITAFSAFIKNFAGSERQPSAHFWLASSHYQLREHAKAAEQYAKVVAGWPNDAKAPDAMLGQANAQIDAGDVKGGNKTLETLIQQYPKSSAAQSARLRLKKK